MSNALHVANRSPLDSASREPLHEFFDLHPDRMRLHSSTERNFGHVSRGILTSCVSCWRVTRDWSLARLFGGWVQLVDMNGCFMRMSHAVIAGAIFFAVIGKPLSSLAGPSPQSGFGAIPYSGVWSNGSSAGTGFGAWQLSPTTNNGNVFYYIQSSTQNNSGGAAGNGGNDINSSGVAWGITALNSSLANATRPFPGALTTSQTFQIDMDNGNINSGGSVGFALQNGSGNSVWEFYFHGGDSTYTINAATTNGPALPSFTRDGLRLTFSLTSASTYSVTVLSYTAGGGTGVGTTTTYTGNLLSPTGGQSISSVRLFNFNAGSGTNNNAYFNNLSISGGTASDNASAASYTTAGTTFRVWAPHATGVNVWGQFNSFSTTATPLYSEGNGNWSADVPSAVNGNQYKYYITTATNSFFKQDPRSRRQASSVGNCLIYNTTNFNWAGDNFTAPALNDTVVYELHCGSFYAPTGGTAGTFYNATNKLAYLKQLGVSAIEVMPVSEFAGDFSWGYNPADLFGVESAYGGPDAFKTFVKTAHQLGLAVLLDVVHNHYGPSDLDLWQFDGWYSAIGGTNYGGIYFYQTACGAVVGYYGSTRPDYDTPQVAQFIKDNMTEWLDEFHVDGFRWDAPGYMIHDNCGNFLPAAATLITNISATIHSYPGGKINIGEDQNSIDNTAPFDETWNGNAFFGDVEPQLATSSDSNRNMGAINSAVMLNPNGWTAGGTVLFLESHDLCGDLNGSGAQRLPTRIDNGTPTSYYARKRSTLGSAITLTSAGIPMILQGEEMLTISQFSASTPINWSLTNTYSGIVSLYTDLIRLRRNLDGRSSGLEGSHTSVIWQDNTNKIIAYRRYNTGNVGDDVIVICNFANTSWPSYNVSNFPHDGTWYTQVNSDWTKYSSDYGNYGSLTTTSSAGMATISIAPYSVLILSQNTPGAPPTPQNFRATSVGTNQVSLAWNPSSGATGYIVKRGGSPIATILTNAYTDTGLSVGVQYCYSVDATNVGGVSADSATLCVTTLPATGDTGLLAYWTFDEGGGSTAYDYSGNSNTGAVVLGSAGAWVGGIVNGALYFDTTSSPYTQVDVTNSPSLNPVNGITVAAWVNDASGGWYNTPRILEKGKTSNQYALFVNSSGSLTFSLAGVSNGTITISPPSSGVWHHLAATYDGSSLMSFYIDGQLVTQQVASGSMPITTDPLAIGNEPGSGSPFNFFSGTIDDVRIYGSALPPDQIVQIYNTDSVGDGIANWWRLQYFGTTTTTDATSCAACDYDGTGQNNLFKFVAGLNPLDPTSVFSLQIANVDGQPTQENLTFTPVAAGRTYTLQGTTDLVNSAFADLLSVSDPLTNGNQVTITDLDASSSNEFYRVHISFP